MPQPADKTNTFPGPKCAQEPERVSDRGALQAITRIVGPGRYLIRAHVREFRPRENAHALSSRSALNDDLRSRNVSGGDEVRCDEIALGSARCRSLQAASVNARGVALLRFHDL